MHTGKIVRVSGPVVDCAGFDGALPKIKEALTVTVGGEVRTMEVAAHIGDGTVRCPPPRFSRPASRSSTCLSPIRRAARSVCSAARAWARPC